MPVHRVEHTATVSVLAEPLRDDEDVTWPYKMDRSLSYIENRLVCAIKLANLRTGHERILDDGTQGVTALVFSDGLCIHREKPLLRGEQNSSTPMRPYGFKDHHGHIRIPPSYSAVHAFSEGLAAVKVTNDFGESKWGFIDTNGRMAISPRFSNEPKDFHDGRAFVEPVDKTEYAFGFIDRTGEVVIKMRTHVAAPDKSFHDGYIFTSDHGDNLGAQRTIPWNPSWLPANGNDLELLILDRTTGREWGLWGYQKYNWSSCLTLANLAAGYRPGVDLCAAMATVSRTPTGEFSDYRTSSGASDGWGRGMGAIQGLALLPTLDEIEKGSINHALNMETYGTMFGPACPTSGGGTPGVDCGYAVAPATREPGTALLARVSGRADRARFRRAL
mgnify:CR=1 FL=1